MKEIYWRFFLNTKKVDKAEKLSASLLEVLQQSKEVKLEPYWKDNKLFCLEIRQDLKSSSVDEIMYEIIKIISKISTSWNLDLPFNIDNENFDFSGISDNSIKFNGITWVSFMLQNKDVSILDIV